MRIHLLEAPAASHEPPLRSKLTFSFRSLFFRRLISNQTSKAVKENKMSAIRGVLLDESVLFVSSDGNSSPSLHPSLAFLLRLLHQSKIRTGITFGSEISAEKESLLKKLTTTYSCDCFIWSASSIGDTMQEITQAWDGGTGGRILCISCKNKKDICLEQANYGWLVIVLNTDVDGACENSRMLHIRKLEELPLAICHLNKKASGGIAVIVGYHMKPSRVEDFAKRGAFPLNLSENGLIFLPLTFHLPIASQLQEVDIVLHKATDEIISVDMSCPLEYPHRISYSSGIHELQRYIEHRPDLCTIDPLGNIYPVLDRLEIQQILLGLQDLNKEDHHIIRGPHFLKVDSFQAPDLEVRLLDAKLSLPSIVKPQVACGVSDAHQMAVVFKVEHFKDLCVPLPAIVQEYVDHSSILYKFYVLGEKVFYAVKNSTPNAAQLSGNGGLQPLVFDSLKSLPTAENKDSGVGDGSVVSNQHIDINLVTDAANWLSRRLGLTIFGFDVVVEEGTRDHVIVDVNYLPSFKEVPDDIAIPAFWDAIKKRYELAKQKK